MTANKKLSPLFEQNAPISDVDETFRTSGNPLHSRRERNFQVVLNLAEKHGLLTSTRIDQQRETSVDSGTAEAPSTFATRLEVYRSIMDKLELLREKRKELQMRRYFADTAHLVDASAQENQRVMLERLETHLKATLDNKNLILDKLCSPQATEGLPIHVSHHESVVKVFTQLHDWQARFENKMSYLHNFDKAILATLQKELADILSVAQTTSALLCYDFSKVVEMMQKLDEYCHLKGNDFCQRTEIAPNEEQLDALRNSTLLPPHLSPPLISSTPYPVFRRSPH